MLDASVLNQILLPLPTAMRWQPVPNENQLAAQVASEVGQQPHDLRSANRPLIEPKALALPTDEGVRLNDGQSLSPCRDSGEHFLQRLTRRARTMPFLNAPPSGLFIVFPGEQQS